MRKLKRILPIIVCLFFVIGIMSACGNDKKDKESSGKGSDSSITTTDSDNSAEADDSNESKSSDSGQDKDGSKSSSDKSASGGSNNDTESGGGSVSTDKNVKTDSTKTTGTDNDSNAGSGNKSSNSKASSDNSSANGGKTSGNNSKASSESGKNNAKTTATTKKAGNTPDKDSSTASDPIGVDDDRTFVITTYAKQAPETCKNFDKLVKDGFYNGLRFYRVINNFLAETGDPNNDGTGGSGNTIKGEFMANGVDNRLSHTKGVVSMQRKPSDKNSADSKFFICYNDNCKFMDGNYAAFGKVTKGMSWVESFQSIERVKGPDGSVSLPVTPITIRRAEYIGKDNDGNSQYKFYVIMP